MRHNHAVSILVTGERHAAVHEPFCVPHMHHLQPDCLVTIVIAYKIIWGLQLRGTPHSVINPWI
jgi:hypothetical protein